jgi:uncharacterized protein
VAEPTPNTLIEAPVELANGPAAKGRREGWGWAFIDLAELGNNRPWRYIVSILRIVLYPVAFTVIVTLLFLWATFGTNRPPPPVTMAVLTFGFVIAAGAAALRSVARTHRRPWLSVVSSSLSIDWRRLAIGASVQASLVLPLLLLSHLVMGLPWRTDTPLPALVTAMLLVPFQAASEEIVFRGYLTQAFGRIFSSRLVIISAVGILFAAIHWNAYGPLTMPYMFTMSLIWSLVTLRDGRLELTIGAHAAMNWLAFETIGSLISRQPRAHITWPYLVGLVVYGLVFYALTRLAVRLLCDRPRTRVAAVVAGIAAE